MEHMSLEHYQAGSLETTQVPFAEIFFVLSVHKFLKVLCNVHPVFCVVRELGIAALPLAGSVNVQFLLLPLNRRFLSPSLVIGEGIPDVFVT